ncbi:hypothetical protein CW751_09150 [Brumimicrobium salinarum]|uniref:Uncharacterized protein n=1 Tax=Brumimicrobium salinarum TaxID=2058658 RepID=A0A2I0R1R5_9FLAO|nr:glycosyl hydrolase family 18 protein [Brumimicrobium salinarum]PKR80531.1 hypothetical protein CW751_09150 [Brumimicrobium salinarum]
MRLLHVLLLGFIIFNSYAQQTTRKSIHQEQAEHYAALGKDYKFYEDNYQSPEPIMYEKANCNLEKRVFGWHPYWNNGKEVNYQWNLLTDFSYFGYEVNPNNGNAYSTRGFATSSAVSNALNNGVNVNLCVTLFNDHSTFFNSASAQQNLINNLITLIQNRGAHGVNIDFESMNSSHKNSFTNFIADLSTQMKNAISGAEISVALHAVDWGNVYDIPALNQHVDLFCLMGYDYYYGGSSTAGPTDPLFHFGNTYNFTLSKSVTHYLDRGVPKNKFIMAIPYYGRSWKVNSFSVPATTVGSGPSVTYSALKTNANGNFSSSNKNIEAASNSTYYNYTSGGDNYQCFISGADEVKKRLEFIRKRGLAGMGMWALGNDDGFPDLWNAIEEKMTDCYNSPCSGTITDIGGGDYRNYYDDEDYEFTIAPENATHVNIEFEDFDVEENYDFLYVYDGANTSASQIPGSPFTGSSIPSNFTSSTGAVTFRFTSDGATTSPGFKINYTCTTVVIDPPIAFVDTVAGWKSTDYTQNFTESVPNSEIKKRYYSVADHNGNEFRANTDNGFFYDNFNDFDMHVDWVQKSGTWTESNILTQSDENDNNARVFAPLNQQLSNHHLYHWKGKISGSGTDRRAGLHIFADDQDAPHGGNSYFVYFRLDDNEIQFFKVENDLFWPPKIRETFVFVEDTWYDFKLIYDRIAGGVYIYINDQLEAQWVDADPFPTGDFVGFKSGGCNYQIDDFMVYRSRYPSEIIEIGADSTNDIRYQNPNPQQPSGMVRSMVTNSYDMISQPDSILVNVDWTAPDFNYIHDGNAQIDLDTIPPNGIALEASANWSAYDPNSGVQSFYYSIGVQPNDNSIVGLTNVNMDNSVTINSQNFVYGELYYFNVQANNNAGLSGTQSSNGFRIMETSGLENHHVELPKIYPNPVGEFLNIEMNQEIVSIGLYDMNGKLLKTIEVSGKSNPISVANFASGTYVLRVKTKGQITEHTWIKQ